MDRKVKTLLKVGLPFVIVIQLISQSQFYWQDSTEIKHSLVKLPESIWCADK